MDVEHFKKKTVPELKSFLKDRGVTLDGRNKPELVSLAYKAHQMMMKIDVTKDDTEKDSVRRRTVNRKVLPQPYTMKSQWTDDLRDLPSTHSSTVFFYLADACEWPRERIRRHKEDNGWLLYKAKHVHRVSVCKVDDSACLFVTAKCVPETRQSGAPYDLWVLINTSGEVLSGECTCVAGNGTCKHVTALLFGLVEVSAIIADSPTSQPCKWSQPSRVKATSQPLKEMTLTARRVPAQRPTKLQNKANDSVELSLTSDEICQRVHDLVTGTKSLILTCLSDETLDLVDDEDEEACLPQDVPPIFNVVRDTAKEDFFSKLSVIFDTNVCERVAALTIGQGDNPAWRELRKGRLTASNFKAAYTYGGSDIFNSTVKQTLGLYGSINGAAMQYGTKTEGKARIAYEKQHKAQHANCTVKETGLHIDSEYPYLGASPDGLVSCQICGEGLLEIKCPYKHRSKTVQDACKDKTFCCEWKDNGIHLKTTHSYFFQVQGQLCISRRNYCDFVVFTNMGHSVERIYLDKEFCRKMLMKLGQFYEKFIVPALYNTASTSLIE